MNLIYKYGSLYLDPSHLLEFLGYIINLYLNKMTSSKKPNNWSEWNNAKHFTDYSRDSKFGKTVGFGIAAMLIVPASFLIYMMFI